MLDCVLICFKFELLSLINGKMKENEISEMSNKFAQNLNNVKSALEILEVVDLLPYDLQEEAAREELMKSIENPQ